MARVIKFSFKLAVYIFALIGFVLVAGFFAVRWNLTKTEGEVDPNTNKYQELSTEVTQISSRDDSQKSIMQKDVEQKQTLCKIDAIGKFAPSNAKSILTKYNETYSRALAEKMIFAVELRLDQNPQYKVYVDACQKPSGYQDMTVSAVSTKLDKQDNQTSAFPWMNNAEWQTIKVALAKDKDQITQASTKADLPPRIVASACIVEQLRLYFTQRELYEKVFQPLQILGVSNKMAWGVMSIKEKSAIDIENHLKDTSSDYYLGPKYENLLNFTSSDPTKERFERLTDEHNHYYSYLYGALYMQEFITQWKKAGYDISNRPEILATLFNLGFDHSQPKANPEVGGSTIQVNNVNYTFGSLAYEFYYSGEMEDSFPLTVPKIN